MTKRIAGIPISKGVTLLELLIVLSIIVVLAAAVIPVVNSIQTFVLDNAVSQVKYALQFAREHARTSGDAVVVRFDTAAGIIRVNRIDFSSGSAVELPVLHPLIKKDYLVELNSQPMTGARSQLRAEFTFADGVKEPSVAFNKEGGAGRVTALNTFVPIQEPGTWRGFWRSGEGYSAGDWIEHNKILYDCLSGHIAGSNFASDLSSGQWRIRTHPGQVTVSAGSYQQQIHVEPVWGFIRVRSR